MSLCADALTTTEDTVNAGETAVYCSRAMLVSTKSSRFHPLSGAVSTPAFSSVLRAASRSSQLHSVQREQAGERRKVRRTRASSRPCPC